MAALFYTNHKANDVQNMFKQWISIWRNKLKQKNVVPSRAVPAIEIDTELANAQYENQNEMEDIENQIGDHLNQLNEGEDGINADIN